MVDDEDSCQEYEDVDCYVSVKYKEVGCYDRPGYEQLSSHVIALASLPFPSSSSSFRSLSPMSWCHYGNV